MLSPSLEYRNSQEEGVLATACGGGHAGVGWGWLKCLVGRVGRNGLQGEGRGAREERKKEERVNLPTAFADEQENAFVPRMAATTKGR